MTRAQQVMSINCTSCGAGLSVLGGGRVRTHICGFCGSKLSAQRNYKVLRKYVDLVRPDSPLKLGDQGAIHGVTYTVIGTLGMQERYENRVWRWVDHQIFSPTHGYGYLTVEDGHLLFSRRMRQPTSPLFLSPNMVARAESPPTVTLKRETYTYYEESDTVITFAEGEFNWAPVIGMKQKVVSAMGEDAMLSFAQTGTEREVEFTTYLHPDTWAGFGVQPPPKTKGVHPLQPFRALGVANFLKRTGFAAAAVCGALSLHFMVQSGRDVAAGTVGLAQMPVEIPLEITAPERLATIDLGTDVNNSWAYFELELTDPDDAPVFVAGREIGYYFGRDSDGAWTEGSQNTRITFRPEQAGTYRLWIGVDETGIEGVGGRPPSILSVRVVEDLPGVMWMFLATLLFALIALIPYARAYLHHKHRWSGSDWSDDD